MQHDEWQAHGQSMLTGPGMSLEWVKILVSLLAFLWLRHWLSDALGLDLRKEAKALYGQRATTLQRGLNDFMTRNRTVVLTTSFQENIS